MLLEINHMGFELFYRHPVEIRKDVAISYDFRITQKNKLTTMINHKLTPVQFSKSGDIWLALCMVNLSFREKPGNVYLSMNGLVQRYSYSFDSRKWKNAEVISLSQREKDILQMSTQGCSNEEIARRLFVEVNTVKFHKKNIFRKFDVKNISEAINFVHNNNLVIE
jgi:DNA-binding CsgD family transcriptional regulator